MSFVSLDLDWSDQSIPNGTKVPVVVTNVQVKPSSANDGTVVLHWDFTITGGEYEGQVVKMYNSLKPNVRFRLETVFSALGLEMTSAVDPASGRLVKKLKESLVYSPETGVVAQPNLLGRPAVGIILSEAGRPPVVQDLLSISTLNGGVSSDKIDLTPPTPAAPTVTSTPKLGGLSFK